MAIDSWGPKAWGFFHAASFNYPETPSTHDRMAWSDLLHALTTTLPCSVCRKHFALEVERVLKDRERSRVLDSRDTLTHWLVDVHNDVNVRNKKRVWSYEEVLQVYKPSERLCRAVRPGEVKEDPHEHDPFAGDEDSLRVSLCALLLSSAIAAVAMLVVAIVLRASVCRQCAL